MKKTHNTHVQSNPKVFIKRLSSDGNISEIFEACKATEYNYDKWEKVKLRSSLDQAKKEQRKKWKLLRKQRKLARKKTLNVRLFYSFCMPKG